MNNLLRKIKKDYFKTPLNGVLTLITIFIIARVVIGFLDWGVVNAAWTVESMDSDGKNGATWAFIINKIQFFLFGFFPKEEIWRILLGTVLIAASFLPYFIKRIEHKSLVFVGQLIVLPIIVWILLSGGGILPRVSTNDWGGLNLTFILSLLGLLYSFPIGIILALGRRSELPVIRWLSIGYIEFFRGIPLITILFMASVVVPFFLPEGVAIDKMLRVIGGMVFFQSAYLAEVIRGGLQSIPSGQYEAAESLGFNYFQKTYLVILPQVLKTTISNIGGISISFIKDTTLVLIIGMFDLLGIVYPLASDSNWLGMEPEGLVFAGLVYWLICYSISKLTDKAEVELNKLPKTGEKK